MSETRDRIIADAKDLPSLIAAAQQSDPALAQALTGKALVASKTLWGNIVGLLVSWAVTRYGLGWSPDTSALVTGLIVIATTAALRAISSGPITGLFKIPTKGPTP